MFRNLRFTIKLKYKPKLKKSLYVLFGILIFALSAFFVIQKYNNNIQTNKATKAIDSSMTSSPLDTKINHQSEIVKNTDTPRTMDAPAFIKRMATCTPEHALEAFQSHMNFNYPDWKVYGKPVIKKQSDCTFRIRFTTIDPHNRLEKEVMIVEITYNFSSSNYYTFKTIRGTLY